MKKVFGLMVLFFGLLLALSFTHVAQCAEPASVTIAGSLQSEIGCPGDWQPDCAATHLTYDANDTVWQGTFAIPVGSWEYKATLNDSWTENYGANATQNGPNISLPLAGATSVKFYYDNTTHWVTSNQNSVIAVAAGSFQSELGCSGDWDPGCLRSWFKDPDGDGIYTFSAILPAGNYETKVAINESWTENYGVGGVQNGANIPFSVPSNGTYVLFSYDANSHILAITLTPSSVTIVGNLQSEIGCPGDWQPDCAATHLTYDANDTVWQGTFAIPAGNWEYKAALNDSWTENYGANATQNGANISLALAGATSVKFYYDHATHWVTSSQNSVIAVAAGSFQSELGCPGDWDPGCLRSWLQDPDGDGIYTFSAILPAGSYETKVAINESWDENYGAGGVQNGPNILFNVPSNGTNVLFSYDPNSHILTVSNPCNPDITPPLISCSADITTEATSCAGEVVTYTASASDNCGLSSLQCTPPPGSTFPVGITTVTCTAVNAAGLSASCSFTVTVNCNHCPTADPLSVSVDQDSSVNFQLPGSDPDGDPLQYIITQAPAHGVVVLQVQTGAVSYSPNPGYIGPDSFKYKVNDGLCDSAEATVSITVADTTPPDVTIITPQPNVAAQDGVTFQAQVTDASAIDSVFFYLRESDGGDGIPIGYENLEATFNTATGYWEYPFDTTVLQDGYYVILAQAIDSFGNEGWSDVVPFSIRNWAVITKLPSTPNSKAGRTMPVKFSLRIAKSVDPAQPFVYNEDLEIRIYRCDNTSCSSRTLMQTSRYGSGTTDYRIDTTAKLYQTNFKTEKTQAQYLVEIWRPSNNFLVGSFAFKTVK